jgi:hypothetical protein
LEQAFQAGADLHPQETEMVEREAPDVTRELAGMALS